MATQKEIQAIAKILKGKRVQIYTQVSGHIFTGDIMNCIGAYLNLVDVVWWNGKVDKEYHFATARISKIEPE